MAEEIVRFPYCVLGDEFRAMLQRPEWFAPAAGAWNGERRDFHVLTGESAHPQVASVVSRNR